MSKLRVLVIDDFALARQVLTSALAADPEIEVVGTAGDAYFAREKIEKFAPDVITLDVDLPKLDGLSFLRALLAVRPMAVVVVSAFTRAGSELALRALELGAVDVLAKPERGLHLSSDEFVTELVDKVKAAARAHLRRIRRPISALGAKLQQPSYGFRNVQPEVFSSLAEPACPVILLGASTGGCEALTEILSSFPADAPPVVCVQHIPAIFSAAFAAQLDARCLSCVSEARSGDVLEFGRVYVAPGGKHLYLREGRGTKLEVRDGPLHNRHRPAIDLTFRSAAELLGRRAIAALLTGMGEDGVAGLSAIREAGGYTLAQDEATSLVFGMPKEAIDRGAAMVAAPLPRIAKMLLGEAIRRRV